MEYWHIGVGVNDGISKNWKYLFEVEKMVKVADILVRMCVPDVALEHCTAPCKKKKKYLEKPSNQTVPK